MIPGIISGASQGAGLLSFAGTPGLIIGGVGGALVGGIMGHTQSLEEERLEKERLKKEEQTRFNINNMNQSIKTHNTTLSSRASYNEHAGGYGRGFNTGFYGQMGGILPPNRRQGVSQDPNRGSVQPVASNAGIARGPSHEQGGIPIPGGEVEGGETIVRSPFTGDTQVHSEELGTSDITNQLTEQKGVLEQQLYDVNMEISNLQLKQQEESQQISKTVDQLERNTKMRELDVIEQQVNVLRSQAGEIEGQLKELDTAIEETFQQQEMQAQQMGMRDEGGQPIQQEFGTGGITIPGVDITGKRIRGPYMTGITPSNQYNTLIAKKGITPFKFSLPDSYYTEDNYNAGIGPLSSSSRTGNIASTAGTILEGIAPFADNIHNYFANKKLNKMQLPEPIYMDASASMRNPIFVDPTVDVSGQLQGIDEHMGSTRRQIDSNVSSSNVGRSMHESASAQRLGLKSQVHSSKDDRERQMRNLNVDIANQTGEANMDRASYYSGINTQMANQYNNDLFQQRVAGIERDSENIANKTSKMMGIISQKRLAEYQDKQIDLQKLIAKGTHDFKDINMALQGIKDPKAQVKWLMENANFTKQEAETYIGI